MRLLNAKTLEFEFFFDEKIPPYLILSHTWGDEEVTYQDMRYLQRLKTLPKALRNDPVDLFSISMSAGSTRDSEAAITATAGYRKILGTARYARRKSLEYFWIDTCCIDKSSSSELQEAINSMYRWYRQSAVCVVFLDDIGYSWDDDPLAYVLQQTRWIKRGWTLQELIAPHTLEFVDPGWTFIATKSTHFLSISKATGIPAEILRYGDLSGASVAQKMSWAAGRVTTRIEDRAYSLLGICDVHMPMLYGEGHNAFFRLQEEILKKTSDDSIFAWKDESATFSTYRGLLARSPDEFSQYFLTPSRLFEITP
ncbi:HET-domain-containing protein [Massarina eburnea CBS 473.64]|uniref:HET-domain-containing protein n=1 Tax=Massarina eburnea CBS 473.64 TaxID=1395130 RepID=A0A6A6RRD4_9PLEO|nr:HET-domain-containing protein [Massarina eburnea CBS 473.64]